MSEITINRTCDGCTKCCQGHLSGIAHGHKFARGTPCFFVGNNSCSIYEQRPEDPCKTFQCTWLRNSYLPMWMRPDLSGVIVTAKVENGEDWLEAHEAGKPLQAYVLSWLVKFCLANKLNLRYMIDGGWHYFLFSRIDIKSV